MRALSVLASVAGLLGGAASVRGQSAATPVPSVKVSGFLQLRETYQERVGLTGTVHRGRLIGEGPVAAGFLFRLSAELRSGGTATTRPTVMLVDAYVRWTRAEWTVTTGQFKTPFGREFLVPSPLLETADRATVSDSLAPRRDIGVMVGRTLGNVVAASFGVFNGEGANTVVNRDSTVLLVGRVTGRFVAPLTLGFNVAHYNADSTRYGWDAAWESSTLVVKGEYLGQHRASSSPDDRGWYLLVAYRFRPWLKGVVKQEDLQRQAVSAAQRNRASTVGVNLRLGGDRVQLFADYVSRKVGSPGPRQGTVIAQLQALF